MAKTRQDQNSESLIDQGKKVMGRPTKRTPEIIEAILSGLSKGTPLTVTCRNYGISDKIVRNWMKEDEELSSDISRARELGFDAIAAEALAIADTPIIGEEITESEDGFQIKKSDMLGHRKLQVETRLKLLAKWDPKRYGDKPEIIVNNNNTNAAATVINLPPDQEEQLKRLIESTRDKVRIKP